MTDINAQFVQAQEDAKQLPERPGNLTLLRLYALFKQATDGDVRGDKPGFTDIVGKYKYDAWAALKGTAQDAAKQQYVDLVESLKSGASA
ncbi:acyl-CoA-binding protein [Paraburkholderia fungorum]|jgi:acyl-CoA-binding protein|uniref:Acyl CoA binding family protein n=1 Tax=Paraburkholderia fungorum TaxID=134537 RepID=A0AAW3UWL2_9BURK|nr:acyl-CoA-binding protein [Paraburkholderia fungorum]AJZ57687.1 acyl CoA binding family protein [Paraburkholderia fungorum]MBB4514619.1 acyl-CoA-binding protein [Paraburkholderia fungorum]MBB5543726.1 acyl-CoA-binding protein [Paraburkholderia fungorum]MBB6202563.1 acyl-CoA-binding protein [Paraburkholderia fungorum]PNE56633.1 acyl-CoA-binding protein [Paraburkholderia fungorum]